MNIENKVLTWLERNSFSLSKRTKRFLAMYFPDAQIRRKFWMQTNVLLGEGTYLGPNVSVSDDYQNSEILLEIGSFCSIAPGTVFAPISIHNNSKILRSMGVLEKYEKKQKIIIGDDVWIGANATILSGVKIGNCCIIGANSLVNIDIPDFSLAYGNPIRVIKDIRLT